jgi:demethylmenaquinone methyltransferase/2-methoxy-6-polyprenyl-1,4-benzoquinol methylase
MNRVNEAESDAILIKPPEVGKDPSRIRRMFAGIARRYDLLNRLLSLDVDRSWRRRAVKLLDPRPGEKILDVCTGTADLALAIARAAAGRPGGGASVVGADFCPEMVRLGEAKRRRATGGGEDRVTLAVADALRLPFPDGAFDAAAVAFGIRNLPDPRAGFREMMRVLRPGGRAAILEFTRPPGRWFRALFGLYFRNVLPRIGRLISRAPEPEARDAYSYLRDSVEAFPDPRAIAAEMEAAGLEDVRFELLSKGIACIHLGAVPRIHSSGANPRDCSSEVAEDTGEETDIKETESSQTFAVILEPRSPRPFREIGGVLADVLGCHLADAMARARSGGGIVVPSAGAAAARALVSGLEMIGVSALAVDPEILHDLPRGVRVRSLVFGPDSFAASPGNGPAITVRRESIAGVHLWGIPTAARTPAEPVPPLADLADSELLSARAAKLGEALRAAGSPELGLTIIPLEPGVPLRIYRDRIDYTASLGQRKMPTSVDNFLLVLEDFRTFAPGVWLLDRVDDFLDRLNPAAVLYRRPEEVQNFERWMQAWIRYQER